jgi:hypothetical protein
VPRFQNIYQLTLCHDFALHSGDEVAKICNFLQELVSKIICPTLYARILLHPIVEIAVDNKYYIPVYIRDFQQVELLPGPTCTGTRVTCQEYDKCDIIVDCSMERGRG